MSFICHETWETKETYPAIGRASCAVFAIAHYCCFTCNPATLLQIIYEYGQACTRTSAHVYSIEGDADTDNERVQLGISASD